MPFVLAGGDNPFANLHPRITDALRTHGCASIAVEVIENSGHYVVDKQPEIVAELIERYASLQKRENMRRVFAGGH